MEGLRLLFNSQLYAQVQVYGQPDCPLTSSVADLPRVDGMEICTAILYLAALGDALQGMEKMNTHLGEYAE